MSKKQFGITNEDMPRERLHKYGLSALSDAELLALILGSGGTGLPVTALASSLITRFGCLKNLVHSEIDALSKVPHIGKAKAASICALSEISIRLNTQSVDPKLSVASPEEVFNLVWPYVYKKKREHLYVLSLDTKARLVAIDLVSIGSLSETLAHPREVFYWLITRSAALFILCHNHPSDDVSPSPEDIDLTCRMTEIGKLMNIPLIDHVVVSDHKYLSIKSYISERR